MPGFVKASAKLSCVLWLSLAAHARTHLFLAAGALALALALGAPLGLAAARLQPLRWLLLGGASIGRTLPSLAVLAFALPLVGVGKPPAILALTLLAFPPILINVDLALRGIPHEIREAAIGMGLSPRQRFVRIELPLAMPLIVAGIRIAAIECVASATLATFVGGGGLGDLIVNGMQTNNATTLFAGALAVAALAFLTDLAFALLARAVRIPA